MTDSRTMAYINMYAVLGTLENLCELDSKAKELISGMKKPVSNRIYRYRRPERNNHFFIKGLSHGGWLKGL